MAKSRIAGAVAVACLLSAAAPQARAQQAPAPQRFDLPAQSLAASLQSVLRATNTNIVFAQEDVASRNAPALAGSFTPAEAVQRLLQGTGLVLDSSNPSLLLVRRAGEPRAAVPAAVVPPRAVAAAPAPVPEELTVVGSRLAYAADGPAPVTVFRREKIDALGVSNVADVLNYLPQQPFSNNDGINSSGTRNAQLRGLALGTTLVLINGRRTVPAAGGVAGGVFDLSGIPLAAVERVEILTDSASAIYGADAVGGVVNVVLKSSVDRPTLDVSYGSADGGAAEKRTSFSAGGHTDRARGTIIVDYFQRDPLLGAARDVSSNADFRRFGSTDRRSMVANPGNICAVSGNLPGLSTQCAAVPAGSTGIGLTPASFLATAGQVNLESLRKSSALSSGAKRYSAAATGSYDLTDRIIAFSELFYTDRTETLPIQIKSVANGLVSAANPFNPFGVAVRANYLLTGLPAPKTVAQETTYSETAGLKGDFRTWNWEISLLGSQSNQDLQTYGNVDSTRLAAALSANSPSAALNVFQDGPGGSQALLASLIQDPSTNLSRRASHSFQAAGSVRGELFKLPTGTVQIAAGAEWRKESVSLVNPTQAVTSDVAKRESSSLYSELRVPVLGPDTGMPIVRDMNITVAGRYDSYSDFGNTFNAQYGVEWRPVPSLLVRGSHGNSYRTPGLFIMYQPRQVFLNEAFAEGDSHRNGEAFTATYITGGNAKLSPEISTSSTLGLVWTPDVSGRPRATIGYWRIKQDQRIKSGVNVSALINNEALFPDRVVRAPRTAADIAAGLPGKILQLDASLINLGSLDTSGVDLGLSADFETKIGRLSPSISATRVQRYNAADYPQAPVANRVGVGNISGSIPRWKAVGALAWSKGGATVTGTLRYTGSYDDASSSNVRNGLKVASSTLFDLQAAMDVGEILEAGTGLANGLRLRVGATNLFNTRAPFSDLFGFGYDPTQGDIRQRFAYLAVSKSF